MLNEIIQGHYNELFQRKQELYNERIKICNKCKLKEKDKVLGIVCSKNKWVNFETGDVSDTPKDGYKNGCGCRLGAKLRLEFAACPNNKW